MAGGLLQIVAHGAQDVYLTGNPQITFFKSVYRRHTNFSMESVKQNFNGTPNFGNDFSCQIQRNADLIHKMYLQTTLPSINISEKVSSNVYGAFRWLNWIGHILIETVSISIGGSKIDEHTGEWLHIWNELTQKPGHKEAYAEMVGNVPKLTQIFSSNDTNKDNSTGQYTLYIPLQFWFCRNPGLSIPLIALQYHDIHINLKLRTFDECIWSSLQDTTQSIPYANTIGSSVFSADSISLSNTHLYVDYIYLDNEERRRFAQVPHEYLIEQLQKNGSESVSSTSTQNIKLNFNHPVKEIIWVSQPSNFRRGGTKSYTQPRAGRQWFNYTDLWDYSGFTGTPEGSYGNGMSGGKGVQNLLQGLPSVEINARLNYTEDPILKPGISAYTHLNAGYDDIKNYTDSKNIHNIESSSGLWTLKNNISVLDAGNNPTKNAKIILNGNERFSLRDGKYFNLIQPYQHHTNSPAPGINVYSFALTPEDHQPSGSCNFSKIDSAHLELTLTDNAVSSTYNPSSNGTSSSVSVRVYATNYNILRIMSGMGGLAYSN